MKLPDDGFEKLMELAGKIPVLIEADGAKRRPLKVPAEHEPVIPEMTTHVLSVYGLDSIGKKIGRNRIPPGTGGDTVK